MVVFFNLVKKSGCWLFCRQEGPGSKEFHNFHGILGSGALERGMDRCGGKKSSELMGGGSGSPVSAEKRLKLGRKGGRRINKGWTIYQLLSNWLPPVQYFYIQFLQLDTEVRGGRVMKYFRLCSTKQATHQWC